MNDNNTNLLEENNLNIRDIYLSNIIYYNLANYM
jgi:hypothetical protein